jgi:hypothetical protein
VKDSPEIAAKYLLATHLPVIDAKTVALLQIHGHRRGIEKERAGVRRLILEIALGRDKTGTIDGMDFKGRGSEGGSEGTNSLMGMISVGTEMLPGRKTDRMKSRKAKGMEGIMVKECVLWYCVVCWSVECLSTDRA